MKYSFIEPQDFFDDEELSEDVIYETNSVRKSIKAIKNEGVNLSDIAGALTRVTDFWIKSIDIETPSYLDKIFTNNGDQWRIDTIDDFGNLWKVTAFSDRRVRNNG